MIAARIRNIDLSYIGLGTYELQKKDMKGIFKGCIEKGLTYFDSADRYDNECDIGDVISSSGILRSSFKIGTKLSYRQQMSQEVTESIDESLHKLRTDHIDVYFIHSPKSNSYCKDWLNIINERNKGKILVAGVSNFGIDQIEELYAASGEYPAINQITVNLKHYPEELISFCKNKNIAIQASCPLCRMEPSCTSSEEITEIMKRYNRSFAQITLRWLYQHQILSIPKMSTSNHLIENCNIFDFEIEENDINILDMLSRVNPKFCVNDK